MILDAVRIVISELFLPQYVEFEAARAGAFVPIELSVSSVFQFLVFALGEEIAWRAFFQRQLGNVWPVAPMLLISSLLFSIGHLSKGNAAVVIFRVSFVFINSVLYGVVYHKTKNAWISTISHFAANVFEVAVTVLFLL
jgi:membrane protease YdiL (CAAX protease family)